MSGSAVTTVPMRDISELLAPSGGRRQPLAGFDADYADIVDYIVRCTHRIWEEKNVGLIYTHYAADCLLHTPTGDVSGVDSVVEGTLKMMAAFPDRVLYADNVIWTGDDEAGFYTSHRLTTEMTNLGASDLGPATGRRARIAVIADCAVKANRIHEEWLVRDYFALAVQLGFDPHEIARRGAALDHAAGAWRWRDQELARVRAVSGDWSALAFPEDGPEGFLIEAWNAIWNGRDLSRVRDAYAPTCTVQAPAGRMLFGHGEVIGFVSHLLGAIPDARLAIDHVAAIPFADAGHDVALRWTLAGIHSGPGLHRPPTGVPLVIRGISHSRVVDRRIVEEWTVFDDLAVLRQMYAGAP